MPSRDDQLAASNDCRTALAGLVDALQVLTLELDSLAGGDLAPDGVDMARRAVRQAVTAAHEIARCL